MANLIKGRHILCVDDLGNPQKDDKGNFYVFDTIDNKVCIINNGKNTQHFFNISDEHPSTSSSEMLSTASTDITDNLLIRDYDEPTISENSPEEQLVSKSKSHETAKWKDENAVKSLIKLWQDHESLFKSSVMKNVEVWRMISDSLQKMNPNWIFTGVQCENKFKDLRRHYTATKDHNAQSGVQPKTCKFFNEMEEVLSMKPSIKPVAVASNLKRRSIALQSPSATEADVLMEAWENSNNSTEEIQIDKKEEPVKKKTRMESQLEAWALSNQVEAQKREEAREKRHQESMEKKERAIKAYETFMSKLLDKL